MRLYSFVNYYLSPLQHGLQTAHCVSNMSTEHNTHTPEHQLYRNWAMSHKTIIICNGGNAAMLEELHAQLIEYAEKFELPLTKFYEDEQSLNGALTSVAIIVPEKFYAAKFVPGTELPFDSYHLITDDGIFLTSYEEDSPEFNFLKLLKSFRLA